MERHLEKLTYVEVKELIERGMDLVILPIGTVEAHGRHLPLATDLTLPPMNGVEFLLPVRIHNHS
jgi:creatinine amidohydrolase/Fe(II)-dependent formamide hydrolase-like protein